MIGLVTGAVLFGLHSLVLLSGDTVGLGDGLLRTLGVVVYATIALFALAAGGLFISTLTENAIAAMAAAVSIAVFSALLDAVPQLSAIHPALLTDHWLGFGELLRTSISGYGPCAMDRPTPRLRRDLPQPRMVTHHNERHHQLNCRHRGRRAVTDQVPRTLTPGIVLHRIRRRARCLACGNSVPTVDD